MSRKAVPRQVMQSIQTDAQMVTAEEAVRCRAYQNYLERGDGAGDALSDWLAAEREVLGASGAPENVAPFGPARPSEEARTAGNRRLSRRAAPRERSEFSEPLPAIGSVRVRSTRSRILSVRPPGLHQAPRI